MLALHISASKAHFRMFCDLGQSHSSPCFSHSEALRVWLFSYNPPQFDAQSEAWKKTSQRTWRPSPLLISCHSAYGQENPSGSAGLSCVGVSCWDQTQDGKGRILLGEYACSQLWGLKAQCSYHRQTEYYKSSLRILNHAGQLWGNIKKGQRQK